MTTSLRERRRQVLQDEILLAATQLVIERGYGAMSMDELAARVGVSKPTLYSHFPTKEDLVVAAVTRAIDRVTEVIAQDTAQRSPLRQLAFIMRTVVQLQVDEGALSPRPWAPELFQILCTRQEVLDRFHQADAGLMELIRAGHRAGEIDPQLDEATVARVFFALLNTFRMPFLLAHGLPNPDTVADTLATIFERGVRAPAG